MTVYAVVGGSLQQIGGTTPVGWIVMQGERPSPDHVAGADGRWVSDQSAIILGSIASNNAAYESAIESLTAGYPPSEIATWERQRAEVMAWAADSKAQTPWIDIAASARDIPRDEYLSRTFAKAALFAHASAYLTGLRQRYEAQIKTAEDATALAALNFDYSLRGAAQ